MATAQNFRKDAIEWTFQAKIFDWANENIDLPLSGYVPDQELVNHLTHNINTDLE